MGGFQKLLVPLDGSRLAEAVLPATMLLAERFGATVLLLHVLEREAPETIHGEPHLGDTREAETYLSGVAERFVALGAAVERHVHPNEESDVVGSIIGHAAEFGADLIVLSTHGWGGAARYLLLGSIAQHVLRRGTLPVLLVKPTSEGEPPPFEGRSMLVPLDGTQTHDGVVLPVVEKVVAGLQPNLHLLVVVPTVRTVSGNQAAVALLTPNAMAATLDMEQEEAGVYLDRVRGRFRAMDITVTADVRRGDPAKAVPETARAVDSDLIVISTHGRSGLGALWSGSLGWKFLSRIQQPLLLVRVPE